MKLFTSKILCCFKLFLRELPKICNSDLHIDEQVTKNSRRVQSREENKTRVIISKLNFLSPFMNFFDSKFFLHFLLWFLSWVLENIEKKNLRRFYSHFHNFLVEPKSVITVNGLINSKLSTVQKKCHQIIEKIKLNPVNYLGFSTPHVMPSKI